MTVPHRIACHIKMAISDQTRPDMGWRRAPLATAYAALRQGKDAWHLAQASGGVSDWLWAPAVSFFHGACCFVLSSSRAGHKLQGLRLRSKACCRAVGSTIENSIFSPDGC